MFLFPLQTVLGDNGLVGVSAARHVVRGLVPVTDHVIARHPHKVELTVWAKTKSWSNVMEHCVL